jgi:hypothetical protein
MAEEVTRQPTVLFTVNEQGQLNIDVHGFSPEMLWGIAKHIEKVADNMHTFQMMQAEEKKRKILRVGRNEF